MNRLFINIGRLIGVDESYRDRIAGKAMAEIGMLSDAWIRVSDGTISDYGKMESVPSYDASTEVIDIDGGWIFPSFCDSHTHIVYAGSREQEFLDKINGLSYEEIAKRGGGILNSADRLHATSEDELYEQAMIRVNEIIAKGTGCVEIKSGYGLNVGDELKMLRVIRRIKESSQITVRSTFLGAHAVGREYAGRQSGYVDMLCEEMIPEVAKQGLAEYIDVFCDKGFFTVQETAKILKKGLEYGMLPKIHANELDVSGGVQVGIEHNAVSVDHLERITDVEIDALVRSNTIPTVLPGASFFLGMPYGQGRRMIDAGLPIALASDYNPGSSPSGDMRFVVSLGCIKMKLTPAEALNAATINGACAMGMSSKVGSISRNKLANFYVTDALPSLAYYPYAYTTPIIKNVFLNGTEMPV